MESSLPAGEQDPSGTPPDPFPAFSGSNRTQGSLSLFWCFRTKSKGGTRKQGRSTLANTAVAGHATAVSAQPSRPMQTQENSAILIGRATFGLYVTICWIVIETQRRGTEPQFAATAPTAGLGELRNRVAHHLGREAAVSCSCDRHSS